MAKDNTLLYIIVVIAVGFLITNPGLTGQYYKGFSDQPTSYDRFGVGNVDRDPQGHVDIFDLDELGNIIQLRKYDIVADLNQDGYVDSTDYNLLEDLILTQGSGAVGGDPSIGGRAGICTVGVTKCGRNTNSGTGTIQVCKMNAYGSPQFYTEACAKGSRCRNGACEFKQASGLH
jgi:hypothetical protein